MVATALLNCVLGGWGGRSGMNGWLSAGSWQAVRWQAERVLPTLVDAAFCRRVMHAAEQASAAGSICSRACAGHASARQATLMLHPVRQRVLVSQSWCHSRGAEVGASEQAPGPVHQSAIETDPVAVI